MILTQIQLDVLNHKVVDGQAWADNVEVKQGAIKGKASLEEKVAKYKQPYLDAQGPDYKNRKQRDDAQAQAEKDKYDNAPWNMKREREYPKISELVVALYDTDDKAAIEKRRADVKAKYPKPE